MIFYINLHNTYKNTINFRCRYDAHARGENILKAFYVQLVYFNLNQYL